MSDDQKPIEIRICMGSSCFSRGNNRTLAVLQEYIARNGLAARVEMMGSLCEGQCKNGPNISINGRMYHQVDQNSIVDIMDHYLNELNGK